jgi:hypothetical protein
MPDWLRDTLASGDAELLQRVDIDFVEQVTRGVMRLQSAGYPEIEDFESA